VNEQMMPLQRNLKSVALWLGILHDMTCPDRHCKFQQTQQISDSRDHGCSKFQICT